MSVTALKTKPALTSTERSRLKRKRDAEAARAVRDVAPTAARVAPSATRCIGAVLILTAVLLAGVGMAATVDYALKTADGADRYLLAALAAAADVLTLVLPTAAGAIWRARRRGLAVLGVLLWLTAAGVTATNVAGFLGVSADAFLTGRETAVAERGLVLERVARLRNERAGISEARPVGVIAVAIRNATRAKVEDERAGLAIAKRRDAIDAELSAVEATIPTLPAVNAADPSAATISAAVGLITGGRVVIADDVPRRVRLLALLALPMFGGLALAIGAALGGRGAP